MALHPEHGEVADGTLGLSAVAGQNNIFGVIGHTHQLQGRITDLETVGSRYLFVFITYGRVIGVVDPVNAGGDVKGERVGIGGGLRSIDGSKRLPHLIEKVRRRLCFLIAQTLVEQQVVIIVRSSRSGLDKQGQHRKHSGNLHN